MNFFLNKDNLNVLLSLQKLLNIKDAASIKNDGFLKDKTFMITGKLIDISRAELKSLINTTNLSKRACFLKIKKIIDRKLNI